MDSLLREYLPIMIFLALAVGLGLVLLLSAVVLAVRNPDAEKVSAYECGFNAFDDARMKFDVRFYLVAILFIIFDLEVTFLFPWAITLGDIGIFGFWFEFQQIDHRKGAVFSCCKKFGHLFGRGNNCVDDLHGRILDGIYWHNQCHYKNTRLIAAISGGAQPAASAPSPRYLISRNRPRVANWSRSPSASCVVISPIWLSIRRKPSSNCASGVEPLRSVRRSSGGTRV